MTELDQLFPWVFPSCNLHQQSQTRGPTSIMLYIFRVRVRIRVRVRVRVRVKIGSESANPCYIAHRTGLISNISRFWRQNVYICIHNVIHDINVRLVSPLVILCCVYTWAVVSLEHGLPITRNTICYNQCRNISHQIRTLMKCQQYYNISGLFIPAWFVLVLFTVCILIDIYFS